MPRGEQLAGENASRPQIAVRRADQLSKACTLISRKQAQKPNVYHTLWRMGTRSRKGAAAGHALPGLCHGEG